jgi:hypothetical protein
MVSEIGSVAIYYDKRAISPPPSHQRVARAIQETAARRLLAELTARTPVLDPDKGVNSSISHSRGVVAAAITDSGRIGIDVEYMCPRRDTRAILELFLGATAEPVSLQGFYRAWTFGEAYFKAFGSLPGKETLAHVIERQAGDSTYRIRHRENGTVGVLHSEENEAFALTLVWVPWSETEL